MFVGIRTLKPFLLDSDRVVPELLQMVASGSGSRGTMQVKVPLESEDDVARFMDLVCRKWEYAPAGTGHGLNWSQQWQRPTAPCCPWPKC